MRCPRCDTLILEDDEAGCSFCGESVYSLLLSRLKEEGNLEPRKYTDYDEGWDQ